MGKVIEAQLNDQDSYNYKEPVLNQRNSDFNKYSMEEEMQT